MQILIQLYCAILSISLVAKSLKKLSCKSSFRPQAPGCNHWDIVVFLLPKIPLISGDLLYVIVCGKGGGGMSGCFVLAFFSLFGITYKVLKVTLMNGTLLNWL